jgi:glutaredoxin
LISFRDFKTEVNVNDAGFVGTTSQFELTFKGLSYEMLRHGQKHSVFHRTGLSICPFCHKAAKHDTRCEFFEQLEAIPYLLEIEFRGAEVLTQIESQYRRADFEQMKVIECGFDTSDNFIAIIDYQNQPFSIFFELTKIKDEVHGELSLVTYGDIRKERGPAIDSCPFCKKNHAYHGLCTKFFPDYQEALFKQIGSIK